MDPQLNIELLKMRGEMKLMRLVVFGAALLVVALVTEGLKSWICFALFAVTDWLCIFLERRLNRE